VVGREVRSAAVLGRLSEAAVPAVVGRGELPDALLAVEGRPLACGRPAGEGGRVSAACLLGGRCCGVLQGLAGAHLRRHARYVAAEAGGPGLLQQLGRSERLAPVLFQPLQQQRHLRLQLRAAGRAGRGRMVLAIAGAPDPGGPAERDLPKHACRPAQLTSLRCGLAHRRCRASTCSLPACTSPRMAS
jgi:hypothetical protein